MPEGQRAPAPEREDEHGERNRREAQPLDVPADIRRDEIRRDARGEVDGKDEPQHAGALDPPGEDEPENAEHDARRRLRQRERKAAAARKQPPEDELEQPGEPDAEERNPVPPERGALRERHAGDHDHEQQERERARREGQRRERGEAPAGSRLERPDRQQRERDPERERKRRGEDDPGPDDGEAPARPACRRAPLAPEHDRERERGERDRRHREQPDPEQRGERVVEEAVGDEAVAARVPEVVPEHEAVLEEQRPLVRVGCEVGPRGAEPGQDGCDARRGGGREHRLAQERVARVHA